MGRGAGWAGSEAGWAGSEGGWVGTVDGWEGGGRVEEGGEEEPPTSTPAIIMRSWRRPGMGAWWDGMGWEGGGSGGDMVERAAARAADMTLPDGEEKSGCMVEA